MKPIEEGCRAVIVNTVMNNGKTVTVIGRTPIPYPYDGCVGNDGWLVDTPIEYSDGDYHFIDEKYLRRIDDEDTTTWEHVAETIGFIPNKQLVEQE
jgi:hypothetical protein